MDLTYLTIYAILIIGQANGLNQLKKFHRVPLEDRKVPKMQTFDVSKVNELIDNMEEIVVYKPVITLVGDEDSDPVVFCISNIEDVKGKNPKTGEDVMRWKLTIHYTTEDENGDTEEIKRAITLSHNKHRDSYIKEAQKELAKSSDGKAHSFMIGVKQSSDKSIRQYHLLAVRDNGELMCECTSHAN